MKQMWLQVICECGDSISIDTSRDEKAAAQLVHWKQYRDFIFYCLLGGRT